MYNKVFCHSGVLRSSSVHAHCLPICVYPCVCVI